MSTTTPATSATKRSTINDDHDHETNNRHDEKKHDHATHANHEHSGHHHNHHPIHHVTQQMRQISVLSVPKRIQPKYSFVSIDEECNRRHLDLGASSVVTAAATATATAIATAVKETATDTETTTTTTTEASKSAFTLLTQFYNELMIPTFPLEEERDDLDDWFLCFREQQQMEEEERSRKQRNCAAGEGDAAVASFLGPAMDVVLMLLNDNDNDDDNESNNKPIIIGGAAIEYYKQSQVGLLSYIVLHEEYRGCGLSKVLHQEALRRLNRLSNCYYYCPNNTTDTTTTATTNNNTTTPNTKTKTTTAAKTNTTTRPPLQAIFAETNTPAAGDVSPAQSLLRHKALYHLGYRLVKFPYAQPPLTTEELNGSFDDIVLLVYFPFVVGGGGGGGDIIIDGKDGVGKEEIVGRYCPWFLERQQQQQQEPPQREKQHQQQQQSNAHERLTNGSNNKKSNSSNGAEAVKMNVNIPFQYVKDFYQSVFGYDDDNSRKEQNDATGSIGSGGSGGNKNDNDDGDGSQEEIPDYRTANYYRLAHWFTHVRSNKKSEKNDTDDNGNTNGGNDENASSMVDVSLLSPPWEDCMESLSLEWKEWENRRKNM